jgi:hypothetical protein
MFPKEGLVIRLCSISILCPVLKFNVERISEDPVIDYENT